ncbi:MAG: hypothetical protein U1F43_30545 [Myxococcota bacterium]
MRGIPTIALMTGLAACSDPGPRDDAARADLAVSQGALADSARTIPYSGYVDFDGRPVNAGGVKLNFALFPCADQAQCAPLWLAKGAWSNGFPAGQSVQLPIFSGRFSVELGGPGQAALPDAVFEDGHEVLYLAIQIEGRTLGVLQKLTPAARAITSSEADRLRVRSAVELDDPQRQGSASLTADDGLVVDHTDPDAQRLLQVGASDAPALVVSRSGVSASALAVNGSVTFSDGIAKRHGTLEDAGMVRAEGGTGVGNDSELLGITLDLSGRAGRWIHVYGGTAIAEAENTSNTSIIRLRFSKPGLTSVDVVAQRQGMGVYGGPEANQTTAISTQAYWPIPPEFAVPGVRLSLVGGIDAPTGNFAWGRQAAYIHFDGESAGATLGYAIF